MNILPNPATNAATIKLISTLELHGNLEVYDFLGRRIYGKVLNTSKQATEKIDVTNWNSGVYHVVFTSEGGIIQRPLHIVKE